MQVGVQPTRHDDGTTVGNAIDQVVDVAPADGGDPPTFPDRLGTAVDQPLGGGAGAAVGLVALEPFVGHRCEAVGCGRPLTPPVHPRLDGGVGVTPSLSRGGPGPAGSLSKRQPFVASASPGSISGRPQPTASQRWPT